MTTYTTTPHEEIVYFHLLFTPIFDLSKQLNLPNRDKNDKHLHSKDIANINSTYVCVDYKHIKSCKRER